MLDMTPNTETHRVASWKAMPFFLATGGLLACVQLLLLCKPAHPSQTTLLLLSIYAISMMPTPMTGFIYAHIANRSRLDLSILRNRAWLGARAGAVSTFALAALFASVVAQGIPADTLSSAARYLVPLVVAGAGLVGGVHGALSAIVLGRSVLEPSPKKT